VSPFDLVNEFPFPLKNYMVKIRAGLHMSNLWTCHERTRTNQNFPPW